MAKARAKKATKKTAKKKATKAKKSAKKVTKTAKKAVTPKKVTLPRGHEHGKWFSAYSAAADESFMGRISFDKEANEYFLVSDDLNGWGDGPKEMYNFDGHQEIYSYGKDLSGVNWDNEDIEYFNLHTTKSQAERGVQTIEGNNFQFLKWAVRIKNGNYIFGCGDLELEEKQVKEFLQSYDKLKEMQEELDEILGSGVVDQVNDSLESEYTYNAIPMVGTTFIKDTPFDKAVQELKKKLKIK